MVKLDEDDDRREGPGRPGPDASPSISTQARFYRDDELKDMLAARQPFGEWAKRITEHRPASSSTDAAEPIAVLRSEELRRRQVAAGFTLEELETDPAPDGGGRARRPSARWATTRRSRCCPSSYRGLHHYFRQNFSQVTNPPIDSLRETRVMTLKTRLGNLGNMLDEDKTPVPTCCSSKARCCPPPSSRRCAPSWATRPARSTAPSRPPSGEAGLRAALDRIRREAEEGVRAGCAHVILTDETIRAGARADPDDPGDRRRCTRISSARACAPSPA